MYTLKSRVERIPKHQAEAVGFDRAHVLGLHGRKPHRKFDVDRLPEQFQQFVGLVAVVEKRVFANPELGPND